MVVALGRATTILPTPRPLRLTTTPAVPVTPDVVVLEVASRDHAQAAKQTSPKMQDVVVSNLEEANPDVDRPRLLKWILLNS